MKPPVARRENHRFTVQGITIEDPYAWLRDKDYPKVENKEILDYLKAENAYFEDRMREASMLTEALFEQMKGRIMRTTAPFPMPMATGFTGGRSKRAGSIATGIASRAQVVKRS